MGDDDIGSELAGATIHGGEWVLVDGEEQWALRVETANGETMYLTACFYQQTKRPGARKYRVTIVPANFDLVKPHRVRSLKESP